MTKHDNEQPQTQSKHHLRRGRYRPPFWLMLLLLVPLLVSVGQPLRVAVISDLNGEYGTTRYEATVDDGVSRLLALKPDLVISTGDMVAGQRRPHLSRTEVEQMWNAFHSHVSEPLHAAGIPLAVTPGNHDASAYDGFDLERMIFGEQWLSRRPLVRFIDDTAYPFHYAFSYGDILFISLDATTVGHLTETGMTWLHQLLARHGADYQRRVVFSHLPLWPFARGREREFIGDPALQALLEEAGVELYLSGHHHTFYPGVSGKITLVSQACLGAGPRRLIGTEERSARSFTLLEFSAEGIQVTAYEAPRFQSPVDWSLLPERIHSSAAVLLRADLAQGVNVRPGRNTTSTLGH